MNYQVLDDGNIPEHISDADAEYLQIKLARCKDSVEAEKIRKQLSLLKDALLIAHKERVKHDSRRNNQNARYN